MSDCRDLCNTWNWLDGYKRCDHMIHHCLFPFFKTSFEKQMCFEDEITHFRTLWPAPFVHCIYFLLFWESRSSAFMSWPWGVFKEDVRDNVAVPLPCTKAIVWCFCHQKMRWVDVLPALIISGMDSRLQNTTWQKCCKSRWHDATGSLRALNRREECSVWVDFAVWDTAKKNLHIWQPSFQSSASRMTWELSLCR